MRRTEVEHADLAAANAHISALEQEKEENYAEIARLKVRIEQHRGALGYAVQGDIPDDPTIQCGLCDAKAKELRHLRAEVKRLRGALEAIAAPCSLREENDDCTCECYRARQALDDAKENTK